MRRWSTTAAVVTIAASLAISCGGDQDAGGSFEPATPGTLTVATSLPALGFWDGDDVDDLTGGFEWGIAEALGERFDVEVTYLDVPFEQLAAGDLGEADLALAQISITDGRLGPDGPLRALLPHPRRSVGRQRPSSCETSPMPKSCDGWSRNRPPSRTFSKT